MEGVYFRDEGDCVVALFSPYFAPTVDPCVASLAFCKLVASAKFGAPELTAKCMVSIGNVAFFQKAHEQDTDDWSAEGQAFVRAARLEQVAASTQQICFFEDEYDEFFASSGPTASTGELYHWSVERKAEQIQGLGQPGGWSQLVQMKYIPNGRIQP